MGTSQDLCYWKLAREGVSLVLNNKQEEAEALFTMYPESIQMHSGLATTQFMVNILESFTQVDFYYINDALMTFEEEKLNKACQIMKDMERRCSGYSNWFRMVRGKSDENMSTYAEHLETQIIRADAQMYLATLTFLQQDISAYFKGGWILRKSWKHYQHMYNEISSLYKEIIGDDDPPENEDINVGSAEDVTGDDESTASVSRSQEDLDSEDAVSSEAIPCTSVALETKEPSKPVPCTSTDRSTQPVIRNGYIPKSHTMHFEKTTDSALATSPKPRSSLKKSQSVNSTLSRCNRNLGRLSSPLNSSLSYISSLNPFNTEGVRNIVMDKETIKRLMCGVSFGYGLMQLGMSLLPPSVLRLTSFLGFQGSRIGGLMNLNYARKGTDMRAPLATLALLWYHTIVRPFFAFDGNNVQAGVEAAVSLINESMEEYANSSLFLFFKGRVHRLKSDIPSAIRSFEASIQNSQQREVRVIAQHEVAWCHLIQLDYKQSCRTFSSLKQQSRWSRPFYTYLFVISAGANETLQDIGNFEEVKAVFGTGLPKGSQLDEFLMRRFKICPANKDVLLNTDVIFWRLLIYELLYLWNSMPSCNIDNIKGVIEDCEDAMNNAVTEPFVGIAALMAGNAHCIMHDYENAVRCFRNCLERRKTTSTHAEDAHVSAFALYELGYLLIKNVETKAEGKQCLHQVNSYKGYDFEQRLSVRIHAILKNL